MNSCRSGILSEPNYVQAYLLLGKAYRAIGKNEMCIKTWEEGASRSSSFGDVSSITELRLLLGQSVNPRVRQSVCHFDSDNVRDETFQKPKIVKSADDIGTFYRKYFAEEREQITPSFLATIRASLTHATGDQQIDDLISIGYLKVNTGEYGKAIEIFERLLSFRADLLGPQLGIGSAQALLGNFDEAIRAFTTALQIDPSVADTWKRRGQTRSAKNLIQDALNDFNKSIELDEDADTFMQRGRD